RQTALLDVVTLDWITADEEYGRNGEFLDELEELEHRYVVEVPVSTTVWTEDPASCIPAYGGRGPVPTRPSRASVAAVSAVVSAPGGVLGRVAGTRHEVEEYFEDAKSYLGMSQYETRSWVGWHHHMSLVGMAHLFITLTRRDLKKKTPELTLDRTVQLMREAM